MVAGLANRTCELRLRELKAQGNQRMEKSFTVPIASLADAINIMLHTQHRPGAAPGPPRCGYDKAAAPGYCGAGEQCPDSGNVRLPSYRLMCMGSSVGPQGNL